MDSIQLQAQRRAGDRWLYWGIGGMIGGVVVGIAITTNYGWTLLNTAFWIGFGIMVGALSGVVSNLLYRLVRFILFNREQTG